MFKKIINKCSFYWKISGALGLLKVLFSKAFNFPVQIKVMNDSVKEPFYLRLPSSDISIYEQVFVKNEYDFNVNFAPGVIVDAGANIGLASILFASRFPNSEIFALEPDKANFEILKKNTSSYSNIVCIEAALWENNGFIKIVDTGLGECGFMTESAEESDKGAIKSYNVKGLFEEFSINTVNLFKIDIEGAEVEVLRDYREWVDRVDSIIVELHERMKPGCESAFKKISEEFDKSTQMGENFLLSKGNSCLDH